MSVKTVFSIKDLENLSGIKAHTIRIWEKRYNLLEPERTDTNIRLYDIDNLTKLLNVTYLYNHGHKISKIAKLKESEVHEFIHQAGLYDSTESFAITELKASMLHFDPKRFHTTYDRLKEQYSFREIFFHIFIPLLNDIGLLWQTGTIDPSHERFISELIKQKISVEIEMASRRDATKHNKLFVLFLPMDEIHEIGLLYANFELLNNGYKTIYLGNNIPTENLHHLLNHHNDIVFTTYLTVKPEIEAIDYFITELHKTVCINNNKIWVFGSQASHLSEAKLPENVQVFKNISQLIEKL
ncbi:MAG: MerR family transcriptional regulator [Flavobacteriaceae bacterium]